MDLRSTIGDLRLHARRSAPLRPTAFSFVEILFAVMILGIGFIMIAAIFPVAIQQGQATLDQNAGQATMQIGMQYLQSIPAASIPPTPTGTPDAMVAYSAGVFASVHGNRIIGTDPRFAWVPLCRRQSATDPAYLYVIAIQSRNQTTYKVTDLSAAGLAPRNVPVALQDGGSDPDRITFAIDVGSDETGRLVAATGAYVIIADDRGLGTANGVGCANGRYYRLGNPIDAANGVWELAPGNDLPLPPPTPPGATFSLVPTNLGDVTTYPRAFIVGRGLRDPSAPFDATSNPYEGPAQDVVMATGSVN